MNEPVVTADASHPSTSPWPRGAGGDFRRKRHRFHRRFLSRNQCRRILEELTFTLWRPSLTYKRQSDGTYHNVLTRHRISKTAHEEWFSSELKTMLKGVEGYLQKRFRIDPTHLEPWQATDYCRNGKFDYHLDAGYWEDHHAGERILTFLLYLNTAHEGGATHFRALDTLVEARAGRLLVWPNLFPNGDCDHRMVHSATPLRRGRKTTLVTWLRQREYRRS